MAPADLQHGDRAPMSHVEVSPEMTMLLGDGPLGDAPLPPSPLACVFGFGVNGRQPTLHLEFRPKIGALPVRDDPSRLILMVETRAYLRIGGSVPAGLGMNGFHLPSELRAIAVALRDCPMEGEAKKVYRLGKSIELLCETIRLLGQGKLVPLSREGALSPADSRRLIEARRMIDERWSEKLTLNSIARACGLNRAKLTSGFREMFDCTVAEAISEKRLEKARRMLLTTDLPISSIGYENGYLNNASFARAFGRRFGVSPSGCRACETVA